VSAAFTTRLRVAREVRLAPADAEVLSFRVQASDIWETVRVVASPAAKLSEVKDRLVAEIFPDADLTDDFVLKLHGWEMLDLHSSIADAGVKNGSIILLAHRRRRPVR
jgi:hypothetical protein